MGIHGFPWASMDVHGQPWFSMGIHVYPWASMVFRWHPWISVGSMVFHVYLLISMGIHGFPNLIWRKCLYFDDYFKIFRFSARNGASSGIPNLSSFPSRKHLKEPLEKLSLLRVPSGNPVDGLPPTRYGCSWQRDRC